MPVAPLLEELQNLYAGRGVNLRKIAGKWVFRTAEDLSYLLEKRSVEERRLSKAALETLSIIAYHQPVTRAEIEEIRGVQTSKGTLDVLLETGWVRMRGRRRAPGRPVTYGTSEQFLEHFGFDSLRDLPGAAELKGAGLLDSALPADFQMPEPTDIAALMPDEDPLEEGEEQLDLLDPWRRTATRRRRRREQCSHRRRDGAKARKMRKSIESAVAQNFRPPIRARDLPYLSPIGDSEERRARRSPRV